MKILGEQFVDLVITDIQMPLIDGLVLLAYMLENFGFKFSCINFLHAKNYSIFYYALRHLFTWLIPCDKFGQIEVGLTVRKGNRFQNLPVVSLL
jgi:hypothetical protein